MARRSAPRQAHLGLLITYRIMIKHKSDCSLSGFVRGPFMSAEKDTRQR